MIYGRGLEAEKQVLPQEGDRLYRELSAVRAVETWRSSPVSPLIEGDDAVPPSRLVLPDAMLVTVPMGIVMADASGRIVHGNAWVERILGQPVLRSGDTGSYGECVSFHADGRRVESHEYPLSRMIRDGDEHSQIDVH
jgi:hypothetical protein